MNIDHSKIAHIKQFYPTETNRIMQMFPSKGSNYIFMLNQTSVDFDVVKFNLIRETVCEFYKVTVEQINTKSREGMTREARHTIAFCAKGMTKLSLARIGMMIGGRDHATVLNSLKRINNYISTGDQIGLNAVQLFNTIKGKI